MYKTGFFVKFLKMAVIIKTLPLKLSSREAIVSCYVTGWVKQIRHGKP